jgi:hypothetical protein
MCYLLNGYNNLKASLTVLIFSVFIPCYSLASLWEREKYHIQLTQLKEQLSILIKNKPCLKKILNEKNLHVSTNHLNKQDCYIQTQKLIRLILEGSRINPKEEYKQFIFHLRNALNSPYYLEHRRDKKQPQIIQLLEIISFWFYTKTNIHTYQQNLTKYILTAGGYTDTKENDYKQSSDFVRLQQLSQAIHEIKDMYHYIKKGKTIFAHSLYKRIYESYQGSHIWGQLDLQKEQSFPNLKFILANSSIKESQTHFIRMSTPTIKSNKDTQINPEFIAYINYLYLQNNTHIYFNFQDNRSLNIKSASTIMDYLKVTGINAEQYRSRAIENLSEQETFSSNLFVSTLGKDSHFYERTAEYNAKQESKIEFISTYIEMIFLNRNCGYYLCSNILKNQSEHRAYFNKIFSQLYDILFEHNDYIKDREKQMFIELSYFFIIEYFSRQHNYVNLTCKDGIDRAGASHAVVYVMMLLVQILNSDIEQDEFKDKIEHIPMILFSDALCVKKREIVYSRINITISAIEYFITIAQKYPQKIKKLFAPLFFNTLTLPQH